MEEAGDTKSNTSLAAWEYNAKRIGVIRHPFFTGFTPEE
jgi:hypothetical protein